MLFGFANTLASFEYFINKILPKNLNVFDIFI